MCRRALSTDRSESRLIIHDDDLEVLHVVRRGRPTGRLEDGLKVAFGKVVVRIEWDAFRMAATDHLAHLCERPDSAGVSHVYPLLLCDRRRRTT
jgi:hypothetical protein